MVRTWARESCASAECVAPPRSATCLPRRPSQTEATQCCCRHPLPLGGTCQGTTHGRRPDAARGCTNTYKQVIPPRLHAVSHPPSPTPRKGTTASNTPPRPLTHTPTTPTPTHHTPAPSTDDTRRTTDLQVVTRRELEHPSPPGAPLVRALYLRHPTQPCRPSLRHQHHYCHGVSPCHHAPAA